MEIRRVALQAPGSVSAHLVLVNGLHFLKTPELPRRVSLGDLWKSRSEGREHAVLSLCTPASWPARPLWGLKAVGESRAGAALPGVHANGCLSLGPRAVWGHPRDRGQDPPFLPPQGPGESLGWSGQEMSAHGSLSGLAGSRRFQEVEEAGLPGCHLSRPD